MTAPTEYERRLETLASIAYEHGFAARTGGSGWARTKARAFEQGGYADVIVTRCYRQAAAALEALGLGEE